MQIDSTYFANVLQLRPLFFIFLLTAWFDDETQIHINSLCLIKPVYFLPLLFSYRILNILCGKIFLLVL